MHKKVEAIGNNVKIHNILKLMKNNIKHEQTIRKQYEKIKNLTQSQRRRKK